MSGPDLLRMVVARLEAAKIPFMLTGSLAAAFHGAGRATLDIDLVIDAGPEQLRTLVESLLGPNLYVSLDAALDARERESLFNVVDTTTGWKVDLIIRKSRSFSQTEFARRRAIEFEGTALWVASLEDVVIAKLEWAKLGRSARQIEDVTALLRVAAGQIDQGYVDRWIADLGLEAQWRTANEGS